MVPNVDRTVAVTLVALLCLPSLAAAIPGGGGVTTSTTNDSTAGVTADATSVTDATDPVADATESVTGGEDPGSTTTGTTEDATKAVVETVDPTADADDGTDASGTTAIGDLAGTTDAVEGTAEGVTGVVNDSVTATGSVVDGDVGGAIENGSDAVGTVGDTVDATNGTIASTTDAVNGTVSGTSDAVSEGTTDLGVDSTSDGVVGETVGTVTGTVTSTVDTVVSTVDDVTTLTTAEISAAETTSAEGSTGSDHATGSEEPEPATDEDGADGTTAAASAGDGGGGGDEPRRGADGAGSDGGPSPGDAAGLAGIVAAAGLAAHLPDVSTVIVNSGAVSTTNAPHTVARGDGRFWRLFAPFRYSRHDDSDPLDHEVRANLYERIERAPGSYLSELDERTAVSLSTVRHHLSVLEREGLVRGEKVRGKRRFYPDGDESVELAAALADGPTAAVLDAVARREPASVGELADELDRDPSTVTHHLKRLEADDLVEREREGRAVVNRLTPEARSAVSGRSVVSADD